MITELASDINTEQFKVFENLFTPQKKKYAFDMNC